MYAVQGYAPEVQKDLQAMVVHWRQLEAHYGDSVSVRFVLSVAKTAEDAEATIAFWRDELKAADAVAGVGQWGTERSAKEFEESYAVFLKVGWKGMCVHAGENCMQAACPSGAEERPGIAAAYTGTQMVRDAITYAGVGRIGHGVEAAKDPQLMKELCEMDVCLEVNSTN